MKYKYILFDLDGTLCESASGIRYSLETACRELGYPDIDLSDYTRYIGPPLVDTFENVCKFPQELWDKAYDIYTETYKNEGILMNKPYEGIENVLKSLKEKGFKLAVCSSKLESNTIRVVDVIGLTRYFDALCGSNRECTRKDKKDLIPYAVEKLGGDLESAVMIGDTFFDAAGAELCAVDYIACAYGYGDMDKMIAYNHVFVADKPGDILSFLTL